jgi:hypothetical protein
MSTSEGLGTDRSGDSRSHQWRIVADRNVAYHLTHNASKSWKIQEKMRAPEFEPWWVASHWTVLPLDYNPKAVHGGWRTPTSVGPNCRGLRRLGPTVVAHGGWIILIF